MWSSYKTIWDPMWREVYANCSCGMVFFIVFLLEIEAFPTGHPTKEAGSSVLLLFEKPVLSE